MCFIFCVALYICYFVFSTWGSWTTLTRTWLSCRLWTLRQSGGLSGRSRHLKSVITTCNNNSSPFIINIKCNSKVNSRKNQLIKYSCVFKSHDNKLLNIILFFSISLRDWRSTAPWLTVHPLFGLIERHWLMWSLPASLTCKSVCVTIPVGVTAGWLRNRCIYYYAVLAVDSGAAVLLAKWEREQATEAFIILWGGDCRDYLMAPVI